MGFRVAINGMGRIGRAILRGILKNFDEYDEKTKIGEMDFEVGLKKIIANM